MLGAMYQTYELYLRESADGPPRFRPLTCKTASDAMRMARELLADEQEVVLVEVRLAGEHLFTVAR